MVVLWVLTECRIVSW